ncbi:MAG: hypothetical protein GF411_18845 [Candidatus Lokiarchaeota archaeon]|nr:hypothetical protein [Candidatus Lokiarchaeota archaeon]
MNIMEMIDSRLKYDRNMINRVYEPPVDRRLIDKVYKDYMFIDLPSSIDPEEREIEIAYTVYFGHPLSRDEPEAPNEVEFESTYDEIDLSEISKEDDRLLGAYAIMDAESKLLDDRN